MDKLIAVNGSKEAWASDPFDPIKDDVTVKDPSDPTHPDTRVRWQSLLKFGHGFWHAPTD